MGATDIATVLANFDDTFNEETFSVNEFGIRFITADGRLRTMRARKSVKGAGRGTASTLEPRGRQMFNLKQTGTMMVIDTEAPEHDNVRTIKPSMMCFAASKQALPKDFALPLPLAPWLIIKH